MKKISLPIIILVSMYLGSVWAQNTSSPKKYTDGIFQISLPSQFVKITGSRLDELRKLMIGGGQELAASSKSADPQDITEKQFSFLAAYEIPKDDVMVTLMGVKNPDVVDRDEMYKTNVQRIEWGKSSGRLSKNSRGVSKLMIDGVPSLLMDIETMSGGRLLTYSLFMSEHNTYIFQIGVSSPKSYFEKNEREIKSIINSVKIVRSR